ncbi:Siderophore (Surfactin) biosynthesis regulatory protein [Lunatimonas lonarensis]|uniref:Siderophore (Surfactin) biosynthesis regulatory protein n=1 Tax=Lunatimonas lonarensis TaxID=1232681 RepID=R7ZT48_9BACT|nr:4'-phosphopantetheinyl transferase superfamily protein [Lunatimonas lonarensis]EON77305.1 Siderophore (Surfactin) biosynthesis regulatory protein [Lunatimonas lonarensis]
MQTKLEKISPLSAFAVNNIHDLKDEVLDFLSFREKLSYANISHPDKRLEWKGARLAVKSALDLIQLPYPGFYKDPHGKSYSMDGYGHVSLSHCSHVAAAIFHREMPVGIDLELVREKTVTVAPKYLQDEEMGFLGKDTLLHTIAWSAKESIFKCQGRKGISLKQHILLQPFDGSSQVIKGRISGTGTSDHHYEVQVLVEGDMVLTYTIW